MEWRTIDRPGYQGKRKDDQEKDWNERFGEDNWRIAWELSDGQQWGFTDIFWRIYVSGYTNYFLSHLSEAVFITQNFNYCFDKDPITKAQAFDPLSQFNKLGMVNQFHDKAANLALEYNLGLKFQGDKPLQVRMGKVDGILPEGWRWSPGIIPATRPDLIPDIPLKGWWQEGTVEDFYQRAKVLQVKTESIGTS